ASHSLSTSAFIQERIAFLVRAEKLLAVICKPVCDDSFDFGDRNPILFHRVAVANRNLTILKRLVIDGDAKRSSHFVLPSIKLAYSRRVVVYGTHRAGSLQP